MSEAAAGTGTDRAARRFPAMPGGRPTRLAAASIGLVAAGILGVQLGQSAIADINPIHFQGPLERPQAITPPPEPAPYDPYAQAYTYRWSMGRQVMFDECVAGDCDTGQSRQAMRLAFSDGAGRDEALPPWRDATPTTELQPWPPGDLPGHGRNVERYLHYPVEPAKADAPPPAAAAPAPAGADALLPAANALVPAPATPPAAED
jgi:hypothetical protein